MSTEARGISREKTALKSYRMYIGGEWVEARSGAVFESFNPYTGKPWALIPRADAEDVNRAVEAAHKASRGPWRSMTATQRGAVMRKLADALVGEADRLAEIEVRDNGKLYAEMVSQTRYLPEWLYYFSTRFTHLASFQL